MSDVPNRKFFSDQQLAEYWGKPREEIEHFVAEIGLRRAFRLSKEKISIGGKFIRGDEISVTVIKSGKTHKDEWLYIEQISEARRSETSVLVGDRPEYPHPEIAGEQSVWVEGPVRRVAIEDFAGQPLSVVYENKPMELELGFLDQEPVVTIEEVERIEQGKPLSVVNSVSGVEKETLLRVIALLTLELSDRVPKFKSSEDKPNSSQIAKSIHKRLPEGEDSPKVDTIRKKIADAMNSL